MKIRSNNRVAAVRGSTLRYDLATKSKVVIKVMESNLDRAGIKNIAKQLGVSITAVNNWVKAYRDVCYTTQNAMPGTMQIAQTVIKGTKNINKMRTTIDLYNKQLLEEVNKIGKSINK